MVIKCTDLQVRCVIKSILLSFSSSIQCPGNISSHTSHIAVQLPISISKHPNRETKNVITVLWSLESTRNIPLVPPRCIGNTRQTVETLPHSILYRSVLRGTSLLDPSIPIFYSIDVYVYNGYNLMATITTGAQNLALQKLYSGFVSSLFAFI